MYSVVLSLPKRDFLSLDAPTRTWRIPCPLNPLPPIELYKHASFLIYSDRPTPNKLAKADPKLLKVVQENRFSIA